MEFDNFVMQLFDEAKSFFDKAKNASNKVSKEAYLHASLLTVMSSLEACVNSIADEIFVEPYKDNYGLLEQSLLLEKEIIFDKGHYKLGNRLKMSRLTERIELLFYIYTGKDNLSNTTWFQQLKQSIDFRNKLVHPKEYIEITDKQVENAILSVLETINELYKVIYKRPFPQYNFGVTSRIDIQ